jgi:lysophospholipase L1-like esterase
MVISVPARCCALAVLLAMLVAASSSARAATAAASGCDVGPITNFLAADATQPGVISLVFFGARGAPVEFFECVDGRLVRLGALASSPDEGSTLRDATTWECGRPSRDFRARAVLSDGTHVAGAYAVRTGSCASRFEIRVALRVAPGRVGRVRIVDRWGIGGVSPLMCISPPHGDRVCQHARLARAVARTTRRFRASARGRWRIELRTASGHRVHRTVTVGPGRAAAPPPVLLATGDSTMQGIDSFLADELEDAATVRSDVRPGTGVSKSDWQAIADAQVKRYRPSVTVVSLGVNEGFDLPTAAGPVACCGEPWIAAYAARVRAMMRRYLRGGRGRVIWGTLPLPRDDARTPMALAVNAAIVRAGTGFAGVTVPRMDLLFSPNGYTDVIRYRGRDVRVRTADGIHLNVSGTAIAAKDVADLLR